MAKELFVESSGKVSGLSGYSPQLDEFISKFDGLKDGCSIHYSSNGNIYELTYEGRSYYLVDRNIKPEQRKRLHELSNLYDFLNSKEDRIEITKEQSEIINKFKDYLIAKRKELILDKYKKVGKGALLATSTISSVAMLFVSLDKVPSVLSASLMMGSSVMGGLTIGAWALGDFDLTYYNYYLKKIDKILNRIDNTGVVNENINYEERFLKEMRSLYNLINEMPILTRQRLIAFYEEIVDEYKNKASELEKYKEAESIELVKIHDYKSLYIDMLPKLIHLEFLIKDYYENKDEYPAELEELLSNNYESVKKVA